LVGKAKLAITAGDYYLFGWPVQEMLRLTFGLRTLAAYLSIRKTSRGVFFKKLNPFTDREDTAGSQLKAQR
jgi:hypothetical protein